MKKTLILIFLIVCKTIAFEQNSLDSFPDPITKFFQWYM